YDRTIDSHVQRLRAKLEEDPGAPRFVRTVWGVGYKFASDAE
ncbi:MAG: helix-turn-helix domain-containing protein, partial [Bacteroidota bacterium]